MSQIVQVRAWAGRRAHTGTPGDLREGPSCGRCAQRTRCFRDEERIACDIVAEAAALRGVRLQRHDGRRMQGDEPRFVKLRRGDVEVRGSRPEPNVIDTQAGGLANPQAATGEQPDERRIRVRSQRPARSEPTRDANQGGDPVIGEDVRRRSIGPAEQPEGRHGGPWLGGTPVAEEPTSNAQGSGRDA